MEVFMSNIRIAVIGAGMAFEPHARSLQELKSEVEVACVVARSEHARDTVRNRYGFPVAESVEAVWHDPSIDAVIILTPPNTHLELARAAADAGKHVLLEKPLDVSIDRARALVAYCEQKNVMLGVVFQHRFRPASLALRQVLQQGELGDLVSVSIQIPWWRPQSYYDVPGRGSRARDGGGVLLTQAIHTIDLALSLAGEVSLVHAHAVTSAVHRMETEDLVAAVLRFSSGAVGSLHATTACYPGFPEQIRLIGTKGSACLEGDALQIRLMDGTQRDMGAPSVLGGGADPMAFSHTNHLELIRSYVAAVHAGVSPSPGGRDALRVQCLIESILESSAAGGPVPVPSH